MKQSLQLRTSQHLALTPQLQQSIRLLQLSTLELHQELEQLLTDNPLLERLDDPLDHSLRLLSDGLVDWLAAHAEQVADQWLAEVRANATTPSYRTLPADTLRDDALVVATHLGCWLAGDPPPRTADEVKTYYRQLARRRRAQGVSLPELLSSLTLLKKHFWMCAEQRGAWRRPVDVYGVLELGELTKGEGKVVYR